MNLERLIRLDGVITHPTPADDPDVFGDTVEDPEPDEPSTLDVKVWLWQTHRTEDTVNADTQAQVWHVAIRATDGNTAALIGQISGSDRLDVLGSTYELDGPPWEATNPRTGRLEFLEATAKKVQ